ncbi:MAG: peptidylprolyl isomerase [Lachnospiraceae bacterium]|nr:peptidylprolyl isomerase [Lachnospiraceae bacterium]
MKKIGALILVICLILSLTACSGDQKETTVTPSSTAEILYPQFGDMEAVALSTEHFSLNKGEMVYLYAISVSEFFNDYYDYISYIGLDPTQSFKKQKSFFATTEEETWFDFFLADATEYAQDYLLFCEAGLAMGLTLDEEDETFINTQKELLEKEAAASGWGIDTYLQQMYSTTLEWKYMESALRLTRLAQKTYTALVGSREFTDEEIEAEYQKNKKDYSLVDFYAVDFGDGENIPDEVLEKVRTDLANVSSLDDFTAVVRDFVAATRTTAAIEDAGGLDKYTTKYLLEGFASGRSYQNNYLFNWAFDEETKEGSVYIKENESTHAPIAYYLVRGPYRDESVTVDVRHIVFLTSTYGGSYTTSELAHEAAEKVYQQWLKEGKTVERFISLCAEYSADGNAASGGLYTGVEPGEMVTAFNDWCFDETRAVGDHGIVDTEYGSHIMYFEGRNITWQKKARTALSRALYDSVRDAQAEKTPVKVRDEILQSINW